MISRTWLLSPSARGVVHPEADGGEDAVAELADGLGDLDERGESGAAGLGAPAVEQLGGLLGVEVPGEDLPEGLLEAVGPPQVPTAAAQLAQRGALVVGEVLRSFEQRPAGPFELLGRGLVGSARSSFQVTRRTVSRASVTSLTAWKGLCRRRDNPFHVVAWATKALDEVRRGLAAELRRGGRVDEASTIKNTRWALLKNPQSLSTDQRSTLAGIQATNGPLYRAYLLKEQLRAVFQTRDLVTARRLLTGWLAWAQRCRLPAFAKLAKTIKKFQQLILNAVEYGLSNARSEATNTHLRLLTRRSYGLSPESLMAMADLTRGGLCPPLPGRAAA